MNDTNSAKRPRRSGRLAVLVGLIITLAGCGDSPTQSDDAHLGTYALVTVDGRDLPYIAGDTAGIRLEITDGTLILMSGGQVGEITTIRITADGEVTNENVVSSGSFVKNGSAFTFQFPSSGRNATGSL